MFNKDIEGRRLNEDINAILQANVGGGGISVAIGSAEAKPMIFCAGRADIVNGKPIEGTHVFGIGSITKVFVAVVVFQLIEEGKLNLAATVGKYLDREVWHDIPDAETATIGQLLNHTSGIDSWEDDPKWIVAGRGKGVRPTHIWGKTEALDYIRRPKMTAPSPGTWSYSNSNYTLLGLIIEKATNNTAEGEIRRRILEPLDLQDTFVEGFEEPRGVQTLCRYHLATPTFRETAGVCPTFPEIDDGLIEVTHSNLSVSWMAGGMMSTPTDLLRFAFALRDGKLLKPASMAAMQEWQPATSGQEMGHGIFRLESPTKMKWMGHFGGVLGFTAGLWWQEKGDCAICVLGNVGTQHAGKASIGAGGVIRDSDFLAQAADLVNT